MGKSNRGFRLISSSTEPQLYFRAGRTDLFQSSQSTTGWTRFRSAATKLAQMSEIRLLRQLLKGRLLWSRKVCLILKTFKIWRRRFRLWLNIPKVYKSLKGRLERFQMIYSWRGCWTTTLWLTNSSYLIKLLSTARFRSCLRLLLKMMPLCHGIGFGKKRSQRKTR